MKQNVWIYANNRHDNQDITVTLIDIEKVREHVYLHEEKNEDNSLFFLIIENNGVFIHEGLNNETFIKQQVTWELYLQQIEDTFNDESRNFNTLQLKILESISPEMLARGIQKRKEYEAYREKKNQLYVERIKQTQLEKQREKEEKKKREDNMILTLQTMELLPLKLTGLQRGQALAGLEKKQWFKVSENMGGEEMCTIFDLITKHRFNRIIKRTEEYARSGEPLAKPRNLYTAYNEKLKWGYRIPGHLGALLTVKQYSHE